MSMHEGRYVKSEDFLEWPNFTEMEVGQTGANFGDVKLLTMQRAQHVRTDLGVALHICDNGLTTGKHDAEEHPDGDAIDFHFDHFISPMRVIAAMFAAGFKGIGVYLNVGGFYSYHGDNRGTIGTWFREYNADGTYTEESIFNVKLLG